jgi:ribosomal protein S27AE
MGVPCYKGEFGAGVDHLQDGRPQLIRSSAPIGGRSYDVSLNVGQSATIRLRGADPDSTQGSGTGTTTHLALPIAQTLVAILAAVPARGNITTASDPSAVLTVGASVPLTEQVVYTPTAGLGGRDSDSFSYQVSDGLLTSANTAQVSFTYKCAPGEHLDETQRKCLPCPAGQFAAEHSFNTVCTPCAAGQWQDLTGQSQCKTCAFGQFQDKAGQASCKACLEFGSPSGFCPSSGHLPSPLDVLLMAGAGLMGAVALLLLVITLAKRKDKIMLGFTWQFLSVNLPTCVWC